MSTRIRHLLPIPFALAALAPAAQAQTTPPAPEPQPAAGKASLSVRGGLATKKTRYYGDAGATSSASRWATPGPCGWL
jgi:hypothetical protein